MFSFRWFVRKVIAWGGEMEVSSLLVEGGDLTLRFFDSKVDPPTKALRDSICRSRDPFLDHLFSPFLDL